MLLLPCMTTHAEVAGSGAYASNSVLASGRWVKIKVRHTGMHQITDGELRAMGFDNPAAVGVYGYPATLLASNRLTDHLPDDVPAVPSTRYGDKLVFYGEGDISLSVCRGVTSNNKEADFVNVSRNYFADYGIYFLTDSHPRAEIAEHSFAPSGTEALTASKGMAHFEEEVQNPGTIGARYLGADFASTQGCHWQIAMPGFNGDGPVNTRLLLGSRLDNSKSLQVDFFGAASRRVVVYSRSSEMYSYGNEEFREVINGVERRQEGLYTVKCKFAGAVSGLAALEYVTALYPRDNRLGEMSQSMFVFDGAETGRNIEFDDEGEDIVAWDVTRRESPQALTWGKSGDRIRQCSLPYSDDIGEEGTGWRYVVVFDPDSELFGVEYAGEVSCGNLHACVTPHMLIVASRDFMPQAQRLAELHREWDGIDVVVALQDEVYNEFSSGTPHLMAIRRLAKMLRDRGEEKFRSILLFGPAIYDSRGLCMSDSEAFRNRYLPMFICEDFELSGHFNKSYATDAFVGMLGEDGTDFDIAGQEMSVAVGRIPAVSAMEADDYVAKVERYLCNPPSGAFHNRAVLICDSGNENAHMADADAMADVIVKNAPATTVFKAYNTLYPIVGNSAQALRKRLVSALSEGVCFLGYSGHGSPTRFAPEELWSVSMAHMTDYEIAPFAMLASCRALYIDHPGECTGSAMLFKREGGAIGVVGATREVYMNQNQVLNLCVGEEFFNVAGAETLGDVFRSARNSVMRYCAEMSDMAERRKLQINTLCYNFAGDPEIKRRNTDCRRMVITQAEDKELGENASLNPSACDRLSVAGCVLDPSGMVDERFDGHGILQVFDGVKTMNVVNGSAEECKGSSALDEDLIYEKPINIENGRFKTDLYLPLPSRAGKHRVSMYASAVDNDLWATGWFDRLSISTETGVVEPTESALPEITRMYIGHDGFVDGDVVNGLPVVYAEIAPNTIGVAGFSSLLGRSMVLSLDGGKRTYDNVGRYFRADEKGGGILEFNPGIMTDGRHRLTLKVTNHAGESSSRTVAFTVINDGGGGVLEIEEYPAVNEATIMLEHTYLEEPRGRIVIMDGGGNVVFTDEDALFPYRWDLTTTDGRPVADGVYDVTAYLQAGGRYGEAHGKQVIVYRGEYGAGNQKSNVVRNTSSELTVPRPGK